MLPRTRIKDIKGWIPESDVDGIEAPENILADVENVDFKNGFINCAIKPSSMSLPSGVSASVLDGYEILSVKHYRHSSRGECFFYLLYKYDSAHLYKYYIHDGYGVHELSMINSDITLTYDGKASYLNYGLVNDQLKINMNVNATFTFNVYNGGSVPSDTKSKVVIANLSLDYLDEVIWAEIDEEVKREAGWYLTPRWLGWSMPDDIFDSSLNDGGDIAIEDFEDDTFEYGILLTDWERTDGAAYTGAYSVKVKSDATMVQYIGGFTATVTDPKTATFYGKGEWGSTFGENSGVWVRAKVTIGADITYHYPTRLTTPDDNGWMKFEIAINRDGAATIEFESIGLYILTGTEWVHDLTFIDNLAFTGASGAVLIGKNYDGQRFMIETGITNPTYFQLHKSMIDWRIKSFELYIKGTTGAIYFLADFKTHKDMAYNTGNRSLVCAFDKEVDSTENETLNFNYGLGAEVGVNNQSIIKSECIYKNRTYFVKDDFRVYQSHLSGTGLAQPDSFPLDIEKSFGFFITDNNEVNTGVFVTPLDELGITTNSNNYVYYVQSSSGGYTFRTRKAINGGRGTITPNSIIKGLNGLPSAGVMGWFDHTGIYVYGGGRNEPVEVSKNIIENYWTSIPKSHKIYTKGIYYKPKNEFWWVLDDFILIFEIDYGVFKKYRYSFSVKDFIGLMDDNLYLLSTDNEVYIIDIDADERLSGTIETHYGADYVFFGNQPVNAPEDSDKIMQEIAINFEPNIAGLAKMEIIADGNKIDSTINFDSAYKSQKVLAPYLLRYGKVKFIITLETTANLREFSYSYTNIDDGLIKGIVRGVYGVGMDSGNNIGQTA